MNLEVQTIAESNDAYHADTAYVGHSMKEVFRRSRRLYYETFIAKTMPPREETPAMLLGSAVHCLAGEPETYAKRFCVAPKCDRRTKIGKLDWELFQSQAAGRSLLTEEQDGTVRRIVDAILQSPLAKDLWACEGPHELTIRWEDKIRQKCRLDKLIDSALIVDLKTSDDPSPAAFARKAANLGYFRQAAYYLDGLKSTHGERGDFVFLVVGSAPPFEVFAFEPDPDDLARAAEQNAIAIEALAKCYEQNEWRTPGADTITKLALPNWSRYDDYLLED